MPGGYITDIAAVEGAWRESDLRSRERRAARTRGASLGREGTAMVAAALIGFIGAAAVGVSGGGNGESGRFPAAGVSVLAFEAFDFKPDRDPGPAVPGDLGPPTTVPSGTALDAAAAYATERGGLVSFATIDSAGRLQGRHAGRPYPAASVIKAMVLAAELERLEETHTPIDSNTDSLLTAMITQSDNAATDVIYNRVGDMGLHAIAERAGMTGFDISGYWGNAQITAADMARFFGDLDRMLPRAHREYGQGLLGSVISSQSWGIPEAAGSSWVARFKGGWLPDYALVHQAAELRERHGPREISLVILTDGQPSFEYGIETVRGLAQRLLTPG